MNSSRSTFRKTERVPLGALPQAVVMSLAHNLTNLFISSYRGTAVIKFGPVLKSLFNKVPGLQDCCKTYLLHALLRFYLPLPKTFKSFINFL